MIYIVKPGDTLSAIARDQLGSASRWPEIAKLNSIDNPNLIHAGDELRLPSSTKSSSGGGFLSRLIGLFRK